MTTGHDRLPGREPFYDPRHGLSSASALLSWAYEVGASSLRFNTGQRVYVRLNGLGFLRSDAPLVDADVPAIANHLCGADGSARLRVGQCLQLCHEVILPDGQSRRFLVFGDVSPCGCNIAVRPLPSDPLSLADQGVEPGILDAFRPREGLVIVSGAAGQGKSTLVAAMTQAKLDDQSRKYSIAEGVRFVQFVMRPSAGSSSLITQSEIPAHYPNKEAFIRHSMRRAVSDIVVDDLRDEASAAAAVGAAISGHVVTVSSAAHDVPSTVARLVSLCPSDERDNLISAVAQSLRLVINQRLVPSTDGRRTALREYLVFDAKLRLAFLQTSPSNWPALTRKAVDEQGQSYPVAIRRAVEEGRISSQTAAVELKEIA
jgi:defect in organelle trafficking protein DotB